MIRLKESADWNRRLEVTGIPTEHKDDPAEMDILITYPMDNVHGPKVILAAVALDRHVIPAIVRAVNSHEALLECAKSSLFALREFEHMPDLQRTIEAVIARAEGRTP